MKNKNHFAILFLCLLSICKNTNLYADFTSPSKQQIAEVTLDQIKYNLKSKGVGLDYRDLFDKAIAEEQIGFLGYHGDCLDFLAYQDIIRVIVEEILEIPVRKDFHFVSIPLRIHNSLQSFDDFPKIFLKNIHYSQIVRENTFPLNFTMYANHNRSGLNTVLNFSKNIGDGTNLRQRELQYLFEELGMDSALIKTVYDISHQYLDSKAGVLLQFFDQSDPPYAFGNKISYGAYPNGFIFENCLISEYFLDHQFLDFPQELRLILSASGILNPTSPIAIKRYTKIQPGKLKAWELELRGVIRSAFFDATKRDEMRKNLQSIWNHSSKGS